MSSAHVASLAEDAANLVLRAEFDKGFQLLPLDWVLQPLQAYMKRIKPRKRMRKPKLNIVDVDLGLGPKLEGSMTLPVKAQAAILLCFLVSSMAINLYTPMLAVTTNVPRVNKVTLTRKILP